MRGGTASSVVLGLVGLFFILRGWNGSLSAKIRGAAAPASSSGSGSSSSSAGGAGAGIPSGSSSSSATRAQESTLAKKTGTTPAKRKASPVVVTAGGPSRRGGH